MIQRLKDQLIEDAKLEILENMKESEIDAVTKSQLNETSFSKLTHLINNFRNLVSSKRKRAKSEETWEKARKNDQANEPPTQARSRRTRI